MPEKQEENFVNLETLAQGAAMELFERELERALENIADPNTEATAKREVKLTFTIKPNKNRDMADVAIQAESKLAAMLGGETTFFIGRRKGKMVALESNPKQLQIKWDEVSRPTPIRKDQDADGQ